MKKLVIFILAALLATSLVACTASETNDLTSINDYVAPSFTEKVATGTISFEEGIGETAIISDYVGLYTAHEIVIPDTIQDRKVISIGKEAFYYCTAATSIKIPDTVETIGDWAFAGCTSLETIVIPASVKSIGKGAFNGCTSLKSVVFEGNAVVTIGDYAFNDCTVLESITLPASVTAIGVEAFRDCEALTAFTAPESLKTIGDMAFYGCTGLNAEGALVLGESIEKIGEFAFADINKLYITAPAGSYAAEYVEEMRDFEETETEETEAAE
ncbi:MAG: leucine-rich repeat domain-containing protein [Clostridia bacterium]|nr:leucine-rich repeat domain-containing protein [Clostridia bacterium]